MVNQQNPKAHQDAIAIFETFLLSNQPKPKGRKKKRVYTEAELAQAGPVVDYLQEWVNSRMGAMLQGTMNSLSGMAKSWLRDPEMVERIKEIDRRQGYG